MSIHHSGQWHPHTVMLMMHTIIYVYTLQTSACRATCLVSNSSQTKLTSELLFPSVNYSNIFKNSWTILGCQELNLCFDLRTHCLNETAEKTTKKLKNKKMKKLSNWLIVKIFADGWITWNQFEFLSSAPTSGFVYRNCTVDGWTEMYPSYEEACAFSDDNEPESEV